jgi:NADPH:quinone reductase-like Zn-dependent oxidoreductase
MKAIVYEIYGLPEVLRIKEISTPTVGEGDVLVRVRATSVNFGDRLARNLSAVTPAQFSMPALFWLMAKLYFGIAKPKRPVLGSEFSGVVELVGSNVTAYKSGDEVFGYLGQKMGAYAEYVCVRENDCFVPKPAGLSHDEAAVLPYGAIMAWNLLNQAGVRKGQKVLVNGASGGIGSAAVQIAKYLGAEVTGVCGTPRLDYVRSLGADAVIDYTQQDFTQSGGTWDLIVDIRGRCPFSRCKGSLTKDGRILYVSFKMKQVFQMVWTSITSGRKVICTLAPDGAEYLRTVCELVEKGALRAPVVERFAFTDATAAHRLLEEGKNTGAVVILGV